VCEIGFRNPISRHKRRSVFEIPQLYGLSLGQIHVTIEADAPFVKHTFAGYQIAWEYAVKNYTTKYRKGCG
jgi:hypothetical protein